MDYLLSGSLHSTLVGKMVSMDHSNDADRVSEVETYVEYITTLLQQAEQYQKDNVKA